MNLKIAFTFANLIETFGLRLEIHHTSKIHFHNVRRVLYITYQKFNACVEACRSQRMPHMPKPTKLVPMALT